MPGFHLAGNNVDMHNAEVLEGRMRNLFKQTVTCLDFVKFYIFVGADGLQIY